MVTHGMTSTPEYRAWNNVKRICYNTRHNKYKNYGGRGIIMCDEWLNSFQDFYDYIGPKPTPQHSLDRINNDGNYEPGNVRWATRSEQNSNCRKRLPVERKFTLEQRELVIESPMSPTFLAKLLGMSIGYVFYLRRNYKKNK